MFSMTAQITEPITKVSLDLIVSTNMRVALALRQRSQTDLAKAMGITRGAISWKMTGRSAWSVEDIGKAGEFLRIQPAKFLDPNGLIVAGSGFEPETSGFSPRGHRFNWPDFTHRCTFILTA